MARWVLRIDLYESEQKLLARVRLSDEDGGTLIPTTKRVDRADLEVLKALIQRGFSESRDETRGPKMLHIARHMTSTFELQDTLRPVEPGDSLRIETIVTQLPWDLLGASSELISERVAVGLVIPTAHAQPTPIDPVRYQSNPRFLHVISDPYEDLAGAEEEEALISELVDKVRAGGGPGLQLTLVPLKNPTPSEVSRALSSPERTPFIHFTCHVNAAHGLLLRGPGGGSEWLGTDKLRSFYRASGEEVVFLNGCDGSLHGGEADMFRGAAVANVFLDAGAAAVIAPRSHVSDTEAVQAARAIWPRVLQGEALGEVLCSYRREAAQSDRLGLAAYSYLLYGSPDHRAPADLRSAEPHPAPVTRDPLIERAMAAGTVTPAGLLLQLTHSWIVAHAYHDWTEPQTDFMTPMLALRKRLADCQPRTRGGMSDAARIVVGDALTRGEGKLTELGLLEALADFGDDTVERCLADVGQGAPTMAELASSARAWQNEGARVPWTLVDLDGSLVPRVFLPDVPRQAGRTPRTNLELLLAIARFGRHASASWRDLELPPPPQDLGLAGLNWGSLGDDTRRALLRAWDAAENEKEGRISEAHVVFAILDDPVPFTESWPPRGADRARVVEDLQLLRMTCIGWSGGHS